MKITYALAAFTIMMSVPLFAMQPGRREEFLNQTQLNNNLLHAAWVYADSNQYGGLWTLIKHPIHPTRALHEVKMLLDAGANPLERDGHGKNTLDYLDVKDTEELSAKLTSQQS